MSLLKTITVDGYYSPEEAKNIEFSIFNNVFTPTEFGEEILNFNMVSKDADKLFSEVLRIPVKIKEEESGVFRLPDRGNMIHFESFNSLNDWIFSVAIQTSTFNLFEHKSGITCALEKYDFNYRNLFEWDLTCNYILKPGQGIFFRPWMFHSFDSGLIQIFKLEEVN